MRSTQAVLLAAAAISSATVYGRNKLQLGDLDWWEVRDRHVALCFPEGSEAVAESTLAIANSEIEELAAEFGFLPDDPFQIVLYPTPGTFRQTDIISSEIDEAVGGFTEFFKGRVVVPYTGSWTEYRHVLTHEVNHAYVFDMLYDRSLQSIILTTSPLWTMEGLAEYTSLGWDEASEAEFRDMLFGGQIVSIPELSRRGDYLVYREGQAIYHFMVERYGRERFRDFVHHLASRGGLTEAVEEAFDMSVSQFDARFGEWARETYWVQVAERQNPSDIGRALETGDSRLVQVMTVISPSGDRIAGVENHHGGLSVVVRSAVDGSLVERCVNTGGFDDTGISPTYRVCAFSPGGDTLAVAVHRVGGDRILLCTGGEVEELPFEMGLVRDPVWSPDGGALAFAGLGPLSNDVFVWEAGGGMPRSLGATSGGERDLAWTPDGILAARENAGEGTWEILLLDPLDGESTVLLRDTVEIRYPAQTPSGLTYVRYEGGMSDIHLVDTTGADHRLTSLYMTMDSPSWADSGRVLSFTSGGFDGQTSVYISYGILEGWRDDSAPLPAPPPQSRAEAFSARVPPEAVSEPAIPEPGRMLRISPYSPVISTDYVSALADYDSYSGLSGSTTFLFSDVLAHHQLVLDGNFNGPVNDADAGLFYSYLPMRTDLGAYIYRQVTGYLFRFPDDHLELVRDVDIGGGLAVSYPFTPAARAEAGADYRHIIREGTWNSDADYSADILSLGGGLVYDTALWDWVGPRVGSRLSLRGEYAPGWGALAQYSTVAVDLREYIWVSRQVSLALRAAGATSWGDQAQRFFVGGAVPQRVLRGETEELGDLLGFYTNYGDMLRGHGYTRWTGRRYFAGSAEMRIPFIRGLALDAPLPLTITNVRGVLFVDAGSAFDDASAFVGADTEGGYRLRDLGLGIGFGFRANLGILLLREDTAWATDIRGIAQKPVHYFTLGASF